MVSVGLRALLLGGAAAAMTGDRQAVLVLVLVGVEAGLASVFRQVQAALLPWLARTPDELTHANTAVSVVQSAAMLAGPAIAAGLLAGSTPQIAMFAACGAHCGRRCRPRGCPAAVIAAAGAGGRVAQAAQAGRGRRFRSRDPATRRAAAAHPRGRPDVRPRGPQRAHGGHRPESVRPGLGRRRLAHRDARRGGRPRRSRRGHARARPEGGALLRRRGCGLGSADDSAGLDPRKLLAVPDVRAYRGGQRVR
jgi:hypothetical protein